MCLFRKTPLSDEELEELEEEIMIEEEEEL